jgi:hypothetical protein
MTAVIDPIPNQCRAALSSGSTRSLLRAFTISFASDPNYRLICCPRPSQREASKPGPG